MGTQSVSLGCWLGTELPVLQGQHDVQQALVSPPRHVVLEGQARQEGSFGQGLPGHLALGCCWKACGRCRINTPTQPDVLPLTSGLAARTAGVPPPNAPDISQVSPLDASRHTNETSEEIGLRSEKAGTVTVQPVSARRGPAGISSGERQFAPQDQRVVCTLTLGAVPWG